jgi:hypothetical protein
LVIIIKYASVAVCFQNDDDDDHHHDDETNRKIMLLERVCNKK